MGAALASDITLGVALFSPLRRPPTGSPKLYSRGGDAGELVGRPGGLQRAGAVGLAGAAAAAGALRRRALLRPGAGGVAAAARLVSGRGGQAPRGPGGVRAAAEALGGGADLRLAWSLPPPGPRVGVPLLLQRGTGADRFHPPDAPAARPPSPYRFLYDS